MNITLRKENIIRMTDSEDRAKVLEAEGYERMGGREDLPTEAPATLAEESVLEEVPVFSEDSASEGGDKGKKSSTRKG